MAVSFTESVYPYMMGMFYLRVNEINNQAEGFCKDSSIHAFYGSAKKKRHLSQGK